MVATVAASARWRITQSGDFAIFKRGTGLDDTWYAAPRVWSGHGLALPEADLPTFAKALAKGMNLPEYWLARARSQDRRAGDASVWSAPRYDPDDELVYVAGPCGLREHLPGYRPTSTFTLAWPHMRGLRIRVAAYMLATRR